MTETIAIRIFDSVFRFFIPRDYEETTKGEQFLQYDNDDDNRILVFGTESSFEFLENSQHWFVDGTFKSVPAQFMQLYTIHGLQRGHNVLCAYGLLRNKEARTYEEMLGQIQRLTNNAIPESIMTDFENGSIAALRATYPNVPLKGCLFHLSKNIYKRVQDAGLAARYLNDNAFRTSSTSK